MQYQIISNLSTDFISIAVLRNSQLSNNACQRLHYNDYIFKFQTSAMSEKDANRKIDRQNTDEDKSSPLNSIGANIEAKKAFEANTLHSITNGKDFSEANKIEKIENDKRR